MLVKEAGGADIYCELSCSWHTLMGEDGLLFWKNMIGKLMLFKG
ncbi:Hypothetical protein CpCap5W_2016 [Corynebacterium pseudotuberculosis]|nr:Hypothetical protein Cp3995_0705 [Corynebacterium pseudotuberculosis 3/99-5]AFH51628.1 Hypothetical protein Cp267_0726 [Corynebacterium pseudotuberculosis 267]AKC73447.1 Hypothetical protein Cp226_0716 [Corynebacterium pseudotuberculosis]ANH24642.1 Hypothetical protein CpE55_1982 [Corynebacterium pseudotuberculosis]ARS61461.1 Hypothetical protein CpATCC19410_2054 [Corynebacterium pseudotuberculosis]